MGMTGQIAAVVGVLLLLGATLGWLKRRGLVRLHIPSRGRERRLEALDRLPLSAQHVLHLVRAGDRVLLVASSPGGCTLLDAAPRTEVGA